MIVLDNVRSLNNIGSVFRTADAFSLEAVFLCGITAKPPHRDIQKTALGATESVDWQYFEQVIDAIQKLKDEGFTIMSIEQAHNSVSLESLELEAGGKYALVLGHEVKGVSDEVMEMSDYAIEIPQYGTKHSLNVSVSAGIAIWEFFKAWKWPS